MSDKHDKPEKPAPAEGDAGADAPAKKSPVKTIGIVAGLMIAEAAAVYFVMSSTGPKPAEATDVHLEGADGHDTEASVELPLMEEKFQNLQTGRVWLWDVEIYLKVKAKHEEFVTAQLESRQAEIKEEISMIFRRAQHSNLKEPGLETIKRQVSAYISHALGKDAEGHERFERVVIPKCKGFPAD
jgi:flagellar basal body-associated protein FliL